MSTESLNSVSTTKPIDHHLAPLQHPSNEQFKDFDDESNHLIASLHLDADEEPRRMGATSRANSVRFDESANQGHWSHASRSSLDFMPRSTSSLGGIPMNERTSSHKSDGRASSVHSIRSVASGRASSLNLDTAYSSLTDPTRSPLETPGVAPGLMILGSVPSIIRCWMNTDFKHNALLYAAISSASYKSHVHLRLLQRLGFEDRIRDSPSGKTVQLPVYFPEAVPHPPLSRSSSPAPQVPTLTVDFLVVTHGLEAAESPSIQIFIGSDILRTHNADIMLSTNSMTLYDDEQCKLSIPLVRPENEAVFNSLYTTGEATAPSGLADEKFDVIPAQGHAQLDGLGQKMEAAVESGKVTAVGSPLSGKYRPPGVIAAESRGSSPRRSEEDRPLDEPGPNREIAESLSLASEGTDTKEASAEAGSLQSTPAQASPAIWSNWRREAPSQGSQFDWSGTSKKAENGYQRRDTGIKVLKPMKTMTRASPGSVASPSPADGKSRFFDEGKRRNPLDGGVGDEKRTSVPSLSRKSSSTTKENQQSAGAETATTRTRTNPAGGASAFSWLTSR